MELEQFCCIGEELACGHCIDLLLGGVLISTLGSIFTLLALALFPTATEAVL
jgi:hypothetical protein